MKQITINGKNYNIKYSLRALFIFEQITNKSFEIKTLLDNYIFFYSMILASNKDSEPFALDGKSVFSKFVVECDENIRARDEVLIVNEEDKLLAYGKSLLSAVEINNFQTGQAIKTRKGFKK